MCRAVLVRNLSNGAIPVYSENVTGHDPVLRTVAFVVTVVSVATSSTPSAR